MPPPPSSGRGGPEAMSTLDKFKMGAMMGCSVGLVSGFIFGAYNIIRFGPGPNGMLRTLAKYMSGSAASFGFFMSVGYVIRTDSARSAEMAFASARGPMIVRQRWEQERRRRE